MFDQSNVYVFLDAGGKQLADRQPGWTFRVKLGRQFGDPDHVYNSKGELIHSCKDYTKDIGLIVYSLAKGAGELSRLEVLERQVLELRAAAATVKCSEVGAAELLNEVQKARQEVANMRTSLKNDLRSFVRAEVAHAVSRLRIARDDEDES